ncbi:MAG TPA: sulfocyanin-like copper-binding protein [Gemmatimonadaceae bacterium]|nr:sulfocyanin-like copper-binding protein [Gemmatimonadaceae bacterium]
MQGLRTVAICAAFMASTSIGAAAQGSGGVAPAHKAHATKPSAAAAKPVTAAATDPVKVNEFMSYNPAAKTVTLKVFSAHGSTNGGMNFNGGASGSQTITIPVGWSVAMSFTNEDAIPHSAIILPNKMPFPAQPQDPAIARAYTADVTGGLMTGKSDQTTFKASPAGEYLLACGVPGHAPSGMWIHFNVSADAKIPAYTTK